MGQVTVFSRPERRRRWTDEDRLQIVAAAFAPGDRVVDVCRRHDVSTGLIYTWRRKLLDVGAAHETDVPEALPAPVFAEAVLDEDAAIAGTIEQRLDALFDIERSINGKAPAERLGRLEKPSHLER